jgi:sec-independent protein translocase protein TatB
MFDLAWSEMAVIAVVALLVIGPKELPEVLRILGRWMAKARGYAREFQNHFEELVREAELKKMREEWNESILEKERLGLEAELMAAARPPERAANPEPASPPPAADAAPAEPAKP